MNLNIRHLKPKIDAMKVMLSQENCIDVFGVNETFLNTTVDDNFLNINGFAFVRKDRNELHNCAANKGGGILIYIRDNINFVRRLEIESTDVESIWIETKKHKIISNLLCL